MNHSRSRRNAFSLIEILVVLGIAALIASLALGGFSSFQGSQRRSTCSSNMVQIYRAARLYENDNGTFPIFTRKVGTTTVKVGGLAMLWGTYDGSPSTGPVVRPPLDGALSYLKSPDALHCPADADFKGDPPVTPPTSNVAVKDDGNGGTVVDTQFLSYQKSIRNGYPDATQWTYDDVRLKPNLSSTQVTYDFARQLRHVVADGANDVTISLPVPSNTVVMWCPFHRGVSSKPDNVLFYDGSVRRMEVIQAAGCLPSRPASAGWYRLSQCGTSSTANTEGAALAQP